MMDDHEFYHRPRCESLDLPDKEFIESLASSFVLPTWVFEPETFLVKKPLEGLDPERVILCHHQSYFMDSDQFRVVTKRVSDHALARDIHLYLDASHPFWTAPGESMAPQEAQQELKRLESIIKTPLPRSTRDFLELILAAPLSNIFMMGRTIGNHEYFFDFDRAKLLSEGASEGLICLSVGGPNDNLHVYVIDVSGEIGEHYGDGPEPGAIWFTDIWDDWYDDEDWFSQKMFRSLENAREVDLLPFKIANDFGELWRSMRSDSLPGDGPSVTDLITKAVKKG